MSSEKRQDAILQFPTDRARHVHSVTSLGAGLGCPLRATAPPAGPHGLPVFGRPSVEGASRSATATQRGRAAPSGLRDKAGDT